MAKQLVWLVTGASSGVGLAVARRCLAEGHLVVACARSTSSLEALAEEGGERLLAVRMDMSSLADIQDVVAKAIARFSRIDVLFNSAGFRVAGAGEEQSDAQIVEQINVNLLGAIRLTNCVLPGMRKAGSGTVIHVGAGAGHLALPGFGIYAATKWGLEGYCESLATEITPLGLKVCLLDLGSFHTERKGVVYIEDHIMDYDGTAGAANRARMQREGKQPGDTKRLALVAVKLPTVANLPVRLPIGSDVYKQMTRAIDERLSSLRKYEDFAGTTDIVSTVDLSDPVEKILP